MAILEKVMFQSLKCFYKLSKEVNSITGWTITFSLHMTLKKWMDSCRVIKCITECNRIVIECRNDKIIIEIKT